MRTFLLMMMLGLTLMFPIEVSAQHPYLQQFNQRRQQAHKDFNEQRKKALQAYAEAVRQHWQQFKGEPPKELPKEEEIVPIIAVEESNDETDSWWSEKMAKLKKYFKKKGRKMPEPVKPKPMIGDGEALEQGKVIPSSPVPPQPEPQIPVEPVRDEPNKPMTFTMFGTDYHIRIGDNCRFKLKSLESEDVADAILLFKEDQFTNMLYDCLEERKQHQLSDWAYYLLLQSVVDKFYGKYNNEGSLVLAFLFTQSGYKARMLHDEQQLYTTVACHHLIFGKSYTIAGGEYYYVLDGRKLPQSVYVCMAKFPQEGSMSLQMSAVQQFALNKTPQRTITSKKNYDFSFTIASNKNYLDFYQTYPRSTVDNNFMTQWVMYAETPLEKGVRDQLYPAISEKIKGLSQLEAVQQILWWVQTGFEYDYDDNVWGEDRPFFGEESIFYPYCDCEDRSILFSHLVRDLVGLDVALVYYPGHLATAVAFTDKVSGDYYVGKDGRHFTVCDPTFINSRVGRTMTSVKGDPATIMELRR